ncbi:MAG: alpha/beta fold hydrolase [Bacteroidales bacterium]|nr:alpha/beta fold hydrolase [Bacteroidales bacterium]
MKRILLVFALCNSLVFSAKAQNSDIRAFQNKYWLAVVANLPLNLTFESSGDSLAPVLYSVFQGNAAIKPTSWSFSGDTLNFRCKDISLKITAVYNRASNSFQGTFKQFVTAEKITFSPAEGPFVANRPQTPQPPYSFDEEEVTITTADGSVSLAGTITYPKQGDKFPAVVLVSGSGQQNRDEEIFMHKPFLVVAEYFARRGIVVLRYDDRGVGGSTGEVSKATTLDFADDAEAAFTFLRKHKRIDSKRVGIVGHSEGALIAQIVAARCRKVSFVAFLGGQGCSGAEVLLQQNRSLFALQGVADSLIDLRLACMREFFNIADTISPKTKILLVLQKVIDSIGGGVPQKQLQEVGLDKKSLLTWSSQLQMPWFKTFLKLTPADYIPKMRCPILALGGEKDVQVLAKENLGKIKELSGGKAQVREMPGLNHLFQHCRTGSPDEYLTIEETISPEVLEILANWILQR